MQIMFHCKGPTSSINTNMSFTVPNMFVHIYTQKKKKKKLYIIFDGG